MSAFLSVSIPLHPCVHTPALAECPAPCYNTRAGKADEMGSQGMEQGMRQSMVATATMQQFMRTLLATNMDLRLMADEALEKNPVLEELPLPPQEEDPGMGGAPDYEATRRHDLVMDNLVSEETLHEHLESQIRRSALPPDTEVAALCLLEHLNDRGFFEEPPERIAAENALPARAYHTALAAIRDLEPAGVGAVDLQDCLLLQLERLGESRSLTAELVRRHWEALATHRYAEAAAALGRTEAQVAAAARRLARLTPDPGAAFSPAEQHVIEPDLVVIRDGAALRVELTNAGIPRLGIAEQYRDMLADYADRREVHSYLTRCIREGKEFIKAIGDRQQTILQVAQAIVARQRPFFLQGPQALLPMRMEDIAEATGVHTSTISRAVNGKYLRCDFGVFELRRFFSAALPAAAGGEAVSADSVQAAIRALIAGENPAKPLSDAKLEAALAEQGITVARRTVAKYREKLKILPAALRKKI